MTIKKDIEVMIADIVTVETDLINDAKSSSGVPLWRNQSADEQLCARLRGDNVDPGIMVYTTEDPSGDEARFLYNLLVTDQAFLIDTSIILKNDKIFIYSDSISNDTLRSLVHNIIW